MKKIYFLISWIILIHYAAIGQQVMPTKEALKKKYENSDVNKETDKNFRSAMHNKSVDDSIVLNPLQYINTYVFIDSADFEFNSISADINIKTGIPADYHFFIAPFCGNINKMIFYSGIITGDSAGRDGMFARWYERNPAALKTEGSGGGDDHEGDNIQVSRKFKFDKGRYRLRLFKSGYIPGKPIPEKYTRNDLIFAWGEYEHSWVTMEAENLQTHEKVVIGSLAFPGKKLKYSARNIIFLEHYHTAINFAKNMPSYPFDMMSYKDLPDLKVDIENIQVNGKKIKPVSVKTHHSCSRNVNQSDIAMPIPLLSTAYYDEAKGIYQYEVGKLQSWKTPKD
jgi:hypothetical protein